jgi:hypothetical protein
MIYLIAIAIGLLLIRGVFAFRTMGAKRKRIEKMERESGGRLSAKDKFRMMK